MVIALNVDIFAVGCLAVIAIGLGTAAFNLIVATAATLVIGMPKHQG